MYIVCTRMYQQCRRFFDYHSCDTKCILVMSITNKSNRCLRPRHVNTWSDVSVYYPCCMWPVNWKILLSYYTSVNHNFYSFRLDTQYWSLCLCVSLNDYNPFSYCTNQTVIFMFRNRSSLKPSYPSSDHSFHMNSRVASISFTVPVEYL